MTTKNPIHKKCKSCGHKRSSKKCKCPYLSQRLSAFKLVPEDSPAVWDKYLDKYIYRGRW